MGIRSISGGRAAGLNSSAGLAVIGIDIGGTNHTAALVSDDGKALEILRGRTDRLGGPAALLESLGRLIPELVGEAEERKLEIEGIGIGFGGPVDFERGRVVLSHHVAGWEDFPLKLEIERLSGLPAVLDNDANAGALGEWRFGAGAGASDVVYYNIGTGIGGAIILGNRLRRGPASIAGELGHTTIQPGGPECTCGQRGCLEALASGSAIARMLVETPIQWQNRVAAADDFFLMVGAGIPAAARILSKVVDSLAISVRNTLHTLNPERVVIGGGVSNGGELLLQPLRARVEAISFPAAFRSCTITRAALGYDAGVIGAAALALPARARRPRTHL